MISTLLTLLIIVAAIAYGLRALSRKSVAARGVLDVLGLLSLPITLFAISFAQAPDTGNGSGAAWLLILTGTTGGFFGILMILSAALSARLAYRGFRLLLPRMPKEYDAG